MNLDSPVSALGHIGPAYSSRLDHLGIKTVRDLLRHVPSRYIDYTNIVTKASQLKPGEIVTLQGVIESIKNQYTHRAFFTIQNAVIATQRGSVKVTWFNQRFLTRSLRAGMHVALAGKVELKAHEPLLVGPDWEEMVNDKPLLHTGRLVPVYPETKGVSSKWLRAKIALALALTHYDIVDYFDPPQLAKLALAELAWSFHQIHFPDSLASSLQARKRLAHDELLRTHLTSMVRKAAWQSQASAIPLTIAPGIYRKFSDLLPFDLTPSQSGAIKEILSDLARPTPMNRLLAGDVGSGKTVVAAAAAFAAFANSTQTAIMAPTQLLATQHFNTISTLMAPLQVRVSLLTSSTSISPVGKTDIFIGTHALIHDKVNFDKVGLVVIDEQHRFGVEQRAHLITKTTKRSVAPHVLTMTATPIPRTIALTAYGDLDLSTLTDMPKGRIPVKTWVVPNTKRDDAYKWIGEHIRKEKSQVFIVCPLIEQSLIESMVQVKAATVEVEEIRHALPNAKVGLLHGKMKAAQKDAVLQDFKSGKLDVLVATPVIEVGIDIANATVMVIETPERFGLAALHQLRGRVGRGMAQSYCLLMTKNVSKQAFARLKSLESLSSGSELAELDLKLRGPGEIYGSAQSGFWNLKIADWSDSEMVSTTRELATAILAKPDQYSLLLKPLLTYDIAQN